MFSISLPGVIAIRATPSVGNVTVKQLTTTISCEKAKIFRITGTNSTLQSIIKKHTPLDFKTIYLGFISPKQKVLPYIWKGSYKPQQKRPAPKKG